MVSTIHLPEIYSLPVNSLIIDHDHLLLPKKIADRLPDNVSVELNGNERLDATNDGEMLFGKKLARKLQKIGGLVQVEIRDDVLKVRTALDGAGKPSLDRPDISFSDPSPLFERICNGLVASPQQFFLAGEAIELSVKPGFDRLIAMSATQDVIPYQHQLDTAAAVLRRMHGRALLCDEVGLGKTIEAGMVLMEYILRGMVKRVLILSPPSLLYQWQEEMARKFNQDFIISSSSKFKDAGPEAWGQFDRIIASIYRAKRSDHLEHVSNSRFDLVIVDEAHHLRNRNTKAWKLVSSLDKKYILLLTATPVQNDLNELFNLITLLKPGQLKTPKEFRKRFVTRGDSMKPQNVDELKRLVNQIMIRNRRSTSGITFTQRHAHTIQMAPTAEERRTYQLVTGLVRDMYNQKRSSFNRLTLKTLQMELGSSPSALIATVDKLLADSPPGEEKERLEEIHSSARSIQNTAKLSALLKTLQRVEEGEKIIVFTRYLASLHWLQDNIEDFTTIVYHGGLSAYEKDLAVQRFRDEKSKSVLLSTDSGGEGRNLQFCHLMVNFDLPWNPMRIEQRIGRLSRIGQERDVYIFNLSVKGTIEDRMLNILDSKINLFELVVGELDMILGRMEKEKDLEEVIFDIVGRSRTDDELHGHMEHLGERLQAVREDYERVKQLDESLFEEVDDGHPD